MTIQIVGYYAKARCYEIQYRTKKNRRNPDTGWQHLTSFRYKLPQDKKAAGVKALLYKISFAERNPEYQVRVVNVTVKQEHEIKCSHIKVEDYLKPFKREFTYWR